MAGILINRITNANIYLNGRSLLGQAESIDLPDVTHKMSDHKALGLVGTPEFPGGIDKLTAKVKWNSYYREVLLADANPTKTHQLQCRGSVETWTSAGRTAEVPIVTLMTVLFKKFPLGKFKQNDNVERESDLAVYYIKQSMGGEDIVELDVLANIYKINNVDILNNYRANIGG